MSTKIIPTQIKHGILQILGDGKPKTVEEITTGLRAQKRKFQVHVLSTRHLPELEAEGFFDRGTQTITLEGVSKLAELDRKGSSPDKHLLVRSRNLSCMDYETYNGAELKRNVGIPDERFAAFELPSVFMGRRVWPDGRSEALDDLGR